jgi:hypothetical protein
MSRNENLGKQLTEMINGLKTVPLPRAARSVVMGEAAYSVPLLLKKLEAFAALWAVAHQKGLDFHAATTKRNERADEVQAFLGELRPAIGSLYGRTNQQLVHFGIRPAKERKKLTAEERAVANAKARSTREHRNGGGTTPSNGGAKPGP